MKREGLSDFFNSQDGKVNVLLLVSVVLIFILSLLLVNAAITITQQSPSNLAINSSRTINFTFTVTWGGTDGSPDAVGNCSIWTNITGTWSQAAVNGTNGTTGGAIFNSSTTISYLNTTLSGDGNFSWAVQCTNATADSTYNFSTNRTLTIDTFSPILTLNTPNGGVLADATEYNITSYETATFYVNVSDNTTHTVSMILNSVAFVTSLLAPTGVNETNRTMTAGTSNSPGTRQYYFNLSGILVFNSSWTSPGPHSVVFCANDSLGRLTCTNRSDFIIKGMNVTQMENMFSTMPQGPGGLTFGGLNITLGNGTEIPDATFMNPIDGVTVGGLTHKNFTFIFNFSANAIVHIVGGRIDESQFANASNSRVNSTPSPEVRQQVGRFTPTMAWADIASFIPSEVSYEYGIMQLGGSHGKTMYCNGSTMAAPNCHTINQCNSTVFGILNHSIVIPPNDACWLTSGTINSVDLSSGFTYIFVDHFSGGVGADDYSQINVTFNGPLFNGFNTSIASRLINITLEDINSTGLNLTSNFSINVTIYREGILVTQFNYINNASTNLSCTSADSVSQQNTTSVTCNVTYAFSNGTFAINATARDTSNKSNPVNASIGSITFTVQSGSPGLVFRSVNYSNGVDTGISAINNTNMTSLMGVSLNGFARNLSISNLTYVSSCNESATRVFSNDTLIFPFNESACPTTSANRTLKVTITDIVGNSNTTVFGFVVDNAAPTLTVHSPIDGSSISNIVEVNVSAFDSESLIDSIGYYLDGSLTLSNHTIKNGSKLTEGIGQNTSIINKTINFTPGTHTIKISVNDTLGNTKNSSVITFTQTGPIRPAEINASMSKYIAIVSGYPANATIRKQGAGGDYQPIGSANETDVNNTFEILLYLNQTSANTQINVTITEINGSGANWDKINFSVLINDTEFEADVENNYTASMFQFVVFNASFEEFLRNANHYFGVILLPFNISGETALAQQIWYFPNASKLSSSSDRTNVSQCTSAFTRTTTTPCWNYTSGGKTLLFVPHFSGGGGGNDSIAPTVNVTTPTQNASGISMFEPNITVSADAITCLSSVNGTVANVTMTKSENICIGQTERFKNLNIAEGGYNFTFTITDSSGNINRYVWRFNVSDNTAPNNGAISSSPSTTTATVTVTGTNESVNVTVAYGTTNTSLGSVAMETDFNVTQIVTISGLTASTTYHYNVTVCDFNGNCKTNTTVFSFLTSTPATAASTTSGGGGGGGGGGGAAAPSNVEASAARQWDSLGAGSSGVLTVNNEKIAVTGVIVDVRNTVTSPSITVESLTLNLLSTAAAAKVYQYLQIRKSNLADSDASKITINFRVPISWLTSNSVADIDVVLYRYSESIWNALPTAKTGDDGNNVLYQSTSPGFSTFAIGSKEAPPTVTPPTEAAPTPEAPVAPEAPAAAAPTPVIEEPVAKGLSNTAIAWIVVAIIVIAAAVGYYIWQKKKDY